MFKPIGQSFFLFLLYSSPIVASSNDVDQQLKEIILSKGLTGKPVLNKSVPSIHSPLAQLGKRLFFSPTLGGKSDTGCVSCHHPLLGGGDQLSLSIGVDAEDPNVFGVKRRHSPKGFDYDGGPTVGRNSPSTFNTVFYSRCMFWDCRIESLGATPGMNGSDKSIIRTPDTMWGMPRIHASSLLEAQVAFPVISENEMRAKFKEDDDNNELRQTLAARILKESEKWLRDFQKAFDSNKNANELITFKNISLAIAAYEASQIFVNTPWKNYVEGNNAAISETAKQGALLFFRNSEKGGYGCAQCHSGDFFTDEQFHVTAIPQIGRGNDDGFDKTHDYGRFIQTGNPDDQFAFRTPTLLNVEITGPYGHTGAYKELRSIIRHMLNAESAIANYDFTLSKLDPGIQKERAEKNTLEALEQLKHLKNKNKSLLRKHAIIESDVEKLFQFLITLTDPCTKNPTCMSPWLE